MAVSGRFFRTGLIVDQAFFARRVPAFLAAFLAVFFFDDFFAAFLAAFFFAAMVGSLLVTLRMSESSQAPA